MTKLTAAHHRQAGSAVGRGLQLSAAATPALPGMGVVWCRSVANTVGSSDGRGMR